MKDYDALTDLYSIAANAAQSAGQWEKAKDYAVKAKSTAQANYDNALAPLSAYQDSWKKAMAESQKNLDEKAELSKLEKPTAEQINRLVFLQKNEQVFQGNVAHGQGQIKGIDDRLSEMKATPARYDGSIESIDKRLKEEAENLAKFKDSKKAYTAAALKSVEKMKDKDSELAYLRRLQVLDPANREVGHKIAVLMGTEKETLANRGSRKKKAH
jgi:hypothetical protein